MIPELSEQLVYVNMNVRICIGHLSTKMGMQRLKTGDVNQQMFGYEAENLRIPANAS